jgi:putative alpha-1,2-mannosidase
MYLGAALIFIKIIHFMALLVAIIIFLCSFNSLVATHQPAQWMGENAEIVVAPGTGEVTTTFSDRGLKFSHDHELSSPQYYKTTLTAKDGEEIHAELTATSRAGYMRFNFSDKSQSPFVTIQATRESFNGEINVDSKRREIYGWNPERQDANLGPYQAEDFKGYFVARFDTDFLSYGTANGAVLSEESIFGRGTTLSAYARFKEGVSVHVRVGVSYISYDQARLNLDSEIPDGVSLEHTVDQVEKAWADKLDLIQLTNATSDERTIFYTAMYHALQVTLTPPPHPHSSLMLHPSTAIGNMSPSYWPLS